MADEPGRPHDDDDFSRERYNDRLDRLLAAMERTPPAYESGAHGIDSGILRELFRGMLAERTANFVPRDEIVKLATDIADARLERAGLRVDTEHVEDTAEAIRGAMRWHRLVSRAWLAAAGTILMGFVYSLARKAGLPVPSGS